MKAQLATDIQEKSEKDFIIRQAVSIEDYQDCEKVQREAWGIQESELVPLHILRPIGEKAGIIMNAYDKTGRPIGTNISFLAHHGGKMILYSHMTGVVPEFQNRGAGLALKLKQRQFAIETGFDLICWTYDPMQSLNNWFNLNKLGALARTYYVNYYGEMRDRLNHGLATDRFLAEWDVQSPRVKARVESHEGVFSETFQESAVVNPTMLKGGVRCPSGKINLDAPEENIFVEIPYDYDRYRDVAPSILQAWREETRQLYTHYFNFGYVATTAALDKSADSRSFVKLERRPVQRILQD